MESPFKGKSGPRRLLDATRYSLAGLTAAARHEAAFRLEILLALVLIPCAFLVGANGTQRALLIGSVLLVLIVELVNAALEAAVDRVSLEHHELAGRAKDLGSAAVMLSLVNTAIVWALVLFG
jgi:diacylglycerol kinase (ATP)